VHSHTEKLYKKFSELQLHLSFCEDASKRGFHYEAEDRRKTGELLFNQMRSDIEDFGNTLKGLSVSRAGPVRALCNIPLCYYALKQSLGSPLDSRAFANGIGLSKRIEDWLYRGLHIADQVLERYFASRRVGT
jgi:hypothetical protein